MDKVECKICKCLFKFVNNTHLKRHSLTIKEYLQLYPEVKIKSDELSYAMIKNVKGKTYEEIHGIDRAAELKLLRSNSAKNQMKSLEQILTRKIKCGAPEFYTDERKLNMSKAITPEVKLRRYNTLIDNIESGKISQKVFGRQSVQAIIYILEYLQIHEIADNMAYYHGGGINGHEFYQVIFNPITNKKSSIAYDFVITSDGKYTCDTIIEINGPWHYRLEEVLQDPDSPSCPLKTNKYTKKESYNRDVLKLNHALNLCNNVYVYWLDSKELLKYENTDIIY